MKVVRQILKKSDIEHTDVETDTETDTMPESSNETVSECSWAEKM